MKWRQSLTFRVLQRRPGRAAQGLGGLTDPAPVAEALKLGRGIDARFPPVNRIAANSSLKTKIEPA